MQNVQPRATGYLALYSSVLVDSYYNNGDVSPCLCLSNVSKVGANRDSLPRVAVTPPRSTDSSSIMHADHKSIHNPTIESLASRA